VVDDVEMGGEIAVLSICEQLWGRIPPGKGRRLFQLEINSLKDVSFNGGRSGEASEVTLCHFP